MHFFFFSLFAINTAVADPPDPPDPPPMPGDHGFTYDVHVGSIDGGLSILLAMSLGYGALAFSRTKRNESEEEAVVE